MASSAPASSCLETDFGIIAQSKNTSENGAESPTTAQPLDMDDDDIQDVSLLTDENKPSATPKKETAPKEAPVAPATDAAPTGGAPPVETEDTPPAAPPKPPRPMTEAQKNVAILKEAFPAVDDGVIKAVLSASGGKVEPAFNALLGKDY